MTTVDERFADLMGRLDHPMVVVTTADGDLRTGCLIGFHSQCGIAPPRYAVWLSKANHTYRVGVFTEVFGVHFLRRHQHALADLFGSSSGDEVDKFERCRWSPGPDGVPLLADSPDRIVGRRLALLDPGTDHVCLVLEPIEIGLGGYDDPADGDWLGFHDVGDLEAGHAAEERQHAR